MRDRDTLIDKYPFHEWLQQPCECSAYYAKYYIFSGWYPTSIIPIRYQQSQWARQHSSIYLEELCKRNISYILQVIFTQSLDTGILQVPSDWLMANVCPVFKKGNHTSTANYRPISLTSVCSKTMEHIIYHSIMNHLNSNSILIDTQHGFRSQHSCVTQLISLIEDLSHALDQQKQTDVILLDFAKAFDSVPHQRLLVKLRHYGINDHICQWVNT